MVKKGVEDRVTKYVEMRLVKYKSRVANNMGHIY